MKDLLKEAEKLPARKSGGNQKWFSRLSPEVRENITRLLDAIDNGYRPDAFPSVNAIADHITNHLVFVSKGTLKSHLEDRRRDKENRLARSGGKSSKSKGKKTRRVGR